MIPIIIQLGPIPINSFGLMMALAILAASLLLAKTFQANGIDPSLGDKFAFTAGVSGLIGARIWFLAEHYNELAADFWSAAFSSAGFTFYGGFIIASLSVIFLCKQNKLSIAKVADCLGPALCLGYAVGRLGCQLSGDGDYGMQTTSFWGMSYATGVIPTDPGVLAYPTPFFESTIALVVMFILLKVDSSLKWQAPFQRFGLYLILISTERFFIEFIRIERKFDSGYSEAQYIALILALIGSFMFLRVRRSV